MIHMQNKLNINAFFYLFLHFFAFRFLFLFSRDENLLNSTFPVMFFSYHRFYSYSALIFLHITAFFRTAGTRNYRYKNLLDETTCTKKICSRQRAIVTGKAATPLPAPTMKETVILFFLFLSFSFLALFSIYKNLLDSFFSVNFF